MDKPALMQMRLRPVRNRGVFIWIGVLKRVYKSCEAQCLDVVSRVWTVFTSDSLHKVVLTS